DNLSLSSILRLPTSTLFPYTTLFRSRIEVGDSQRIGDERSGAGAAAWTHRNALRLCPLDEVGNDQKVAGIVHALDHAELKIQPLDRKSTRLNSSHQIISYAVFCLKKK